MEPIYWYSNKQNTVETSTFGSELVSLRIDTDLIGGFRYKLRMFGVPIDESAQVFCDNESVVSNCTYLESTLKKKHCSVVYHRSRESISSGMMVLFYER